MSEEQKEKQQLENEIRNIFNTVFKKKIKRWIPFNVYRYDNVLVQINSDYHFIDFYFFTERCRLCLDYENSEILSEVYPMTAGSQRYTVPMLRQRLKLLKRFVLFMI
jgi:hypothetical protein